VERRLVAEYLAERARRHEESGAEWARRFAMCVWAADEPEGSRRACARAQYAAAWQLPKARAGARPAQVLSREGVVRMLRRLSARRGFLQLWRDVLRRLLACLSDAATGVRSRAMRALLQLVQADPAILRQAEVQRVVKACLADPQASVRDAALDLLGKFVLSDPRLLLPAYLEVLSACAADASVSVRRRAVRTIAELCAREDTCGELVPQLALRLVPRTSDPDTSVARLSTQALVALCLGGAPRGEEEEKEGEAREPERHLQQILALLELRGGSGAGWFGQLLERALAQAGAQKRLRALEATCRRLCELLMRRLLELEEQRAHLEPAAAAAPADALARLSAEIARVLSVLQCFARARPALVVPYVARLRAYLRAGPFPAALQATELQAVQAALGALEAALPQLRDPSEDLVRRLRDDFVQLSTRLPSMPAVDAALRCLCTLAQRVEADLTCVYELARRFEAALERASTRYVRPLTDQASLGALLRSVFALASLARHLDWSTDAARQWGLPERAFPLYQKLAARPELQVRLMAVQGLANLCIAQPSLLPRASSVFAAALEDDSADLRLQTLRGITDFLRAEEERVRARNARPEAVEADSAAEPEQADADAESNAEAEEGAGQQQRQHQPEEEDIFEEGVEQWGRAAAGAADADSGLTAGVLQNHLPRLQALLLDTQTAVRAQALTTVQAAVKAGLLHPLQVLAQLVALCADREAGGCAERALAALAAIEARQPGLLQSRLQEGTRLAFEFQRRCWGHADARLPPQPDGACFFAGLLHLGTRARRHALFERLLTDLIRLLEDDPPVPLPAHLPPLLRFAADLVAFMPFACVSLSLLSPLPLRSPVQLRRSARFSSVPAGAPTNRCR
jgi:cohesin loading factor subunit SCC2